MKGNRVLASVFVIASLALIALGAVKCAAVPGVVQQAQADPTPTIAQVTRMSAEELHRQLQGPNPPQVWDLRGLKAYTDGHIPDSRLVQYTDASALAQQLDRKQAIVTLCA
jgi:hypothetical protein